MTAYAFSALVIAAALGIGWLVWTLSGIKFPDDRDPMDDDDEWFL